MSSKLDEIKNNATHTKQHDFFTEIPYEDYLWLIEQAERAEIYKNTLIEIGSKCKLYDQIYDDREKIRAERERLYLELAEKDKVLESVEDEIDNSIEMLREDAFENWDEAVNVLTSASRSIRSILSKYDKEEETK